MSGRDKYNLHLPVVAVLLAAFGTALYRLAAKSLSGDEAFAPDLVSRGVAGVLSASTGSEPHPPLYYLSLSMWLRLTGKSEFALRFLSLLAGLAVVALVYTLSRRLGGRRSALLAATFTAFSPYLTYYSQEVRMFTLATTLAAASAVAFFSALKSNKRRHWALTTAVSAAACYTFYFNLLPAVFLGLLSLAQWARTSKNSDLSKVWRRATIAHLGVAGALLPWLPVAWQQLTAPGVQTWRVFTGPWDMVWRSLLAFELGHAVDPSREPWLLLGGAALGLLWIIGLSASRQFNGVLSETEMRLTLAFYLAFPLFVILILSLIQPLYHERYVIVLFPVFIATAFLAFDTSGAASFPRQEFLNSGTREPSGPPGEKHRRPTFFTKRRLGTGFIVVLLVVAFYGEGRGLAGWYFDRGFSNDDYRAMISYLEPRVRPGDVVIVTPGWVRPAVEYYLRYAPVWRGPVTQLPPSLEGLKLIQVGHISEQGGKGGASAAGNSDDYPINRDATVTALQQLGEVSQRIWLVRVNDTVSDPQAVVLSWLKGNYFELDERWFEGVSYPQLYLFSTRRPPDLSVPSMQQHAAVKLDDSVELLGNDLSPGPVRSGELIHLRLFWKATGKVSENYKVFVHLLDYRRQQWAGVDNQPLMNRRPTKDWLPGEVIVDDYDLLVPNGIPSGLYTLEVGMYDPNTMQRLGKTDIDIGQVVVRRDVVLPPQAQMLSEQLGSLELAGYAGPGSSDLRSPLRFSLYWRALAGQETAYTVFAHLLDASGALVAQSDGPPAGGAFPTTAWPVGDIVEDNREVPLSGLKAGVYKLVIGLYDPATGQRLKSRGGVNHVEMTITLK